MGGKFKRNILFNILENNTFMLSIIILNKYKNDMINKINLIT